MFKIDNEKELFSFLKILAEESVNKSKKQLNETTDELSNSFKKRLASEEELYEQEEADPELDAGAAEEETPEEDEAQDNSDQEEPEEKPRSDNQEELKASLDALERNINALRAGRSLKDSTVESQLEIYFDRLGDDEKELMVLFIRELSKILSGEIDGNTAADPNKDPYNLDVVSSDEPEVKPTTDSTPSEEETGQEEVEMDEPEEDEGDEEDTSPPIKVGEPQNLAEIRKRIKKLMSR